MSESPDSKSPVADTRPNQELSEHVRDLIQRGGGSLSGVLVHYRVLLPGLLCCRVPNYQHALQQYISENSEHVPLVVELPSPVVTLFPGNDVYWDRMVFVLPQESHAKLCDWLLGVSFADRDRSLVVWTDFDRVSIPDASGHPVGVDAVILRSNKGAWRYRPADKAGGRPAATFYPGDVGIVRMSELAQTLDITSVKN